ncbi:MAG: CRISPR-associated endonuclease Cas1 [Dehalococcoidales bacterium]|nr:CRISPR-associated endonuclease Cas1 [Dehalococcoidales bacterium]
MPVLYLIEQGAKLHKEGELFTVTKDDKVVKKIHAIEVEQIILFGNITMTTPVINYVLENGIDCTFCNSYGKFHGRLVSDTSRFGMLRLKQMGMMLNPEYRLKIARSIVQGKLHNQRTLMLRYRRKEDLPEINQTLQVFEDVLRQVPGCNSCESLRGLEGSAGAAYYRAFKNILNQDLGFVTRVRRPPTDPINSLLSFGYTLLTYALHSAISVVGLDPYLGIFHATEQSRPNLALDMVEEFRPIIVDSMVLWLINSKVMTLADFHLPQKSGELVVITDEGIKKLIHYYEMKVQSKIFHPALNGQTSYRHCFELQVRQLAKTMLTKGYDYTPFLVR